MLKSSTHKKDARRNISWTFSAKSILGKGIQANAPYNTHQTINAVYHAHKNRHEPPNSVRF